MASHWFDLWSVHELEWVLYWLLLLLNVHLHSLRPLTSVHVLYLLEAKSYFLGVIGLIPWLLLVEVPGTVHCVDFLLEHPDSFLLKFHCIVKTAYHSLLFLQSRVHL